MRREYCPLSPGLRRRLLSNVLAIAFVFSRPLRETMLPLRFLNLFSLLLITFLLAEGAARAVAPPDGEATPAATVITNRAAASYSDEAGNRFDTISETVSLTVLAVSAVVVTPDETE